MRKFECPIQDKKFKGAYIILPDIWLGEHAERRDKAVDASKGTYNVTLMNFAVSMALLEDWNLPGLNGNTQNWDFNKFDLRLIAWISKTVLEDYNKVYEIPKVSSSPLPDQ